MLGRGSNASGRLGLRTRNDGKPSMTRAASWTNGEAALSNSAGLLVICLTCRAMASRAASFGSVEAKAFRQLDLGPWLRKTAASSTGLKINQGKPKGVPGGYQ
jgi:hypothetical protein